VALGECVTTQVMYVTYNVATVYKYIWNAWWHGFGFLI